MLVISSVFHKLNRTSSQTEEPILSEEVTQHHRNKMIEKHIDKQIEHYTEEKKLRLGSNAQIEKLKAAPTMQKKIQNRKNLGA